MRERTEDDGRSFGDGGENLVLEERKYCQVREGKNEWENEGRTYVRHPEGREGREREKESKVSFDASRSSSSVLEGKLTLQSSKDQP